MREFLEGAEPATHAERRWAPAGEVNGSLRYAWRTRLAQRQRCYYSMCLACPGLAG